MAAVLLVVVVALLALNLYQYSFPRSITVTTTSTKATTIVSKENNTITTTETSTSTGGSETSSVLSDNGIQLAASINATTITVGQRLNIAVSILNTLSKINAIRPSNGWPFQGVPIALWPACYFGLPAEVAVLEGNLTLKDLQTVANTTFNYGCMEGVTIDHVIFQPESNQANLTGVYSWGGNQTLGPFRLAFNFTTAGSWNLLNLSKALNIPILGESQRPGTPPPDIPFTPGEYTVAVADEWGQAVILHVTVTGPSNTIYGSFTYTSTGPVQVDSVQATQFVCQNCGAVNGESYVTFAVAFDNIGNSPIYIPDGSGGVSTSVPANSSVIQEVASERCAGTYSFAKLNPGQNYTLYSPSCETGFDYQLVQAGSVNVTFSFNWTTNSKASTNPTDFPNSTTISANFTFA